MRAVLSRACVLGVLVAVPASATPVAIVNGTFDQAVTFQSSGGAEEWSAGPGTVPGWTTNASAGVWHPSAAQFDGTGSEYVAANNIPSGSQVLLMSPNGSASQVLTTNLAANTRYTLTFYFGQRADYTVTDDTGKLIAFNVALQAAGTTLATATAPATLPTPGHFAMETLVYSTGATVTAGQALGIAISEPTGGPQEVFDSVSLDATLIPEAPGAALLFPAALLLAPRARPRPPAV